MKLVDCEVRLLRYRLAAPVGGSGVAAVDVLVARARLEDGAEGLGFSYVLGGGAEPALLAARALAAERLVGRPLHHPEAAWRSAAAALNRTRRGPNYVGLAALDVALWDAYARSLDVPLAVAMGGDPAREIAVYGSGDFNVRQSPDEAAEAARRHAQRGFRAVKPRVAARRSDEAVVRAVRDALPGEVELMLDANEKGTATTAARLLAIAQACGALFVEEPLPADDLAGYRALAAASPGGVATGEHLQGAVEAAPFITERLCAVIQPDLAMMGGLTETLRVARLAESFGVEVSPHFLPGLFVHVACAQPNVAWLEDFPLLEPLFSGWPAMSAQGTLKPAPVPGHGLALADGAEAAFGVDV
jgi:L-alanine-DL-glutamate epimerase-like enolase superfamily enzyme